MTIIQPSTIFLIAIFLFVLLFTAASVILVGFGPASEGSSRGDESKVEDKSPSPCPALESAAITPKYDIDVDFETLVGTRVKERLVEEKRRKEAEDAANRERREKMKPLIRAVRHMVETHKPVRSGDSTPMTIKTFADDGWIWIYGNLYSFSLCLGWYPEMGYHVYRSSPTSRFNPQAGDAHNSYHEDWRDAYKTFLKLISSDVVSYKGLDVDPTTIETFS